MQAVEARLEAVINQLFFGDPDTERLYFENPDGTAYALALTIPPVLDKHKKGFTVPHVDPHQSLRLYLRTKAARQPDTCWLALYGNLTIWQIIFLTAHVHAPFVRLLCRFCLPCSYIKSIDSNDVRTEGMSYAMNIAVQRNNQTMFDVRKGPSPSPSVLSSALDR